MSAGTLMTTTLPTIVDAGVVSRATDTMFGRRERGTKRRSTKRSVGQRVGNRKIHVGPKGGRYIVKRGRKVYI